LSKSSSGSLAMSKKTQDKMTICDLGVDSANRRPCGVVLLVTLVVLSVLAMVGYTLTSRVSAQRHRDNYIIDYSKARYACDSAVKYALATLEDVNEAELIARPNEPDFSDVFALSDEQYQELLDWWAATKGLERNGGLETPTGTQDMNDVNDINLGGSFGMFGPGESNDANSIQVRGPYGPPWPLVAEPMEFEIGSAKVTIAIEDENAKYPLGWAMLDDDELKREAEASFETFCEWMGLESWDIDLLKSQLSQVKDVRKFKIDFQPIKKRTPTRAPARRGRSQGRRATRTRYRITTISPQQQLAEQTTDFARLFHCSLIDTETLARPTIVSDEREESALKYTGLWATVKVSVNTAPRHVLEAAFTFGGDAKEIAEQIIQERRIKPFKDIEELRSKLLRYSTSVEKCERFITTKSDSFTIRVTASSGVAKASAVIAVRKEGKNVKKVGVVSG